MIYLQTYKAKSLKDYQQMGLAFLMSGDYMGSAEFEFGSVQKSYRYLNDNKNMKIHEVTAEVNKGDKAPVVFSVIADDHGLAHFKETIESHLDAKCLNKPRTKERTGLLEKFALGQKDEGLPDFWFSIDRYVGYTEEKPVIAFSDRKELVLGFFLHFTAGKLNPPENKEAWTPRMFEEVYCFRSIEGQVFNVAGLNEDGSVTLRGNHKTIRLAKSMVYPVNTSAHHKPKELSDIFQRAGLKT